MKKWRFLIALGLTLLLSACHGAEAAPTDAPTPPSTAGETVSTTAATTEPTSPATQPPTTAPQCKTHVYGDWIVENEATCAAPGSRSRACTVCGAVETEEIPSPEHTFGQWETVTAATCVNAGTQRRECTVCGAKETGSIPAAGHSYGDWAVTTAATCTTPGSQSRTCTVCGNVERQTVAASHNWSAWSTTQTERWDYNADGSDIVLRPALRSRSCTLCGQQESEEYVPSSSEKDALALSVARSIAARAISEAGEGATDLEKISIAAGYVCWYSNNCFYNSEVDPDYRTAYGVFVKGIFTCAGSTRAMGMVLTCMGYSWEHVNENQWTHQWCKVWMDGQWGYADGQVGLVGYGNHPKA